MVAAESWFRSIWKVPRRRESGLEKELVGVLAFEVASLMSKLVHLWQSLSDKQVAKLREDVRNSVGMRKLVSEDEEFIARLICSEMIDGMVHVAKSVARLGNKCQDPTLKGFEHVFDELIRIGSDPYGWGFTWKKMDKKVKKMERFISVNATLYQEMELLADLEQMVRRLKSNDPEQDNLLEYQKKLVWKKQEVKNLRDISLWIRTYDYVVLLLARSLFTIFSRINHVFFGVVPMAYSRELKVPNSGNSYGHQSVSAVLQAPIRPSENGNILRFASGPLGRFPIKSDSTSKTKGQSFYSGPLRDSSAKSGPLSGKSSNMNFFSGPLGNPTAKLGAISGISKIGKKMWQIRGSPIFQQMKPHSKPNKSTQVGPFKGCMEAGNSPANSKYYSHSTVDCSGNLHGARGVDYLPQNRPSIVSSKFKLLNTLPDTLGTAALALHYANVIIVIEKLVASPHLIGHDARDDLYNMLPASVKSTLRARLKPYSKNLASSVYDTELAQEWTEAMASILEWLAPLAHNMIRWQSERSFEQQCFVSRTNVLLAQTLFFANQEKTEATIIELLVGLNYVWRFGRELNAKALRECASNRVFDECLDSKEVTPPISSP